MAGPGQAGQARRRDAAVVGRSAGLRDSSPYTNREYAEEIGMTFVGVRIENGEFEVGFKASSYREYQDHIRMVVAAVDLLWPQVAEAPLDLSRDPAEGIDITDFPEPPTHESIDKWAMENIGKVDEQKRRRKWLEKQGLA